jgi:16S rRNA (guanine966-N2)-methyltransferase
VTEIRVSGGELRGRRLRVPRRGVRPTTEKVREAAFSILGDVSGARVIDLFCGTGALAIEALSRGAAEAVLVDTHPAAARRNLETLGLTDRASTVRSEATRFLRRVEPGSFDLVFCDPPYRLADRLAADLVQLIPGTLGRGARALIESHPERPLDLNLPLITERTYGDTMIRIYGDHR